MSEHTPGPWRVIANHCIEAEPLGPNGPIVEVAYTQDGEWLEQTANAHLIAAAPDLLAACDALDTYSQHNDVCSAPGLDCPACVGLATAARDLLALARSKARGEVPA